MGKRWDHLKAKFKRSPRRDGEDSAVEGAGAEVLQSPPLRGTRDATAGQDSDGRCASMVPPTSSTAPKDLEGRQPSNSPEAPDASQGSGSQDASQGRNGVDAPAAAETSPRAGSRLGSQSSGQVSSETEPAAASPRAPRSGPHASRELQRKTSRSSGGRSAS